MSSTGGGRGGEDREGARREAAAGKRPVLPENIPSAGLSIGRGLVVGVEDLDAALAAALAARLEPGSRRASGVPQIPFTSSIGAQIYDGGLAAVFGSCTSGGVKQEPVAASGPAPIGLAQFAPNTHHPTGSFVAGVYGASSSQFVGGPSVVGNGIEGLDLIGAGRSFMLRFELFFIDRLDCPPEFGRGLIGEIFPAVRIRGSTPHYFSVATEVVGSRVRFSKGWEAFVEAEKLISGDFGLFVLVRPNMFEMRVFDHNGNEKPMARRPAVWNLYVAYGEQAPTAAAGHAPPPEPMEFVVPAHLLGMQYEMGPRLNMSGPLMQALNDVWLNSTVEFPLYACKLNHSHSSSSSFYFCTSFSKMLPALPVPVSMFEGRNNIGVGAMMKKRLYDGLARLCSGWRQFVRFNDYQEDDVLVFAIRNNGGRMLIRVFRVMGA